MFIVFDGMDGAGKTTQLELFIEWLTEIGHDVVRCKDPGDTAIGRKMRELLLGTHDLPISMRAELLMFMAARAQLVDEIIKPALQAGKTVVCDRFVFSTVVYQGYGGGIDPDLVWQLNEFAIAGCQADLTFLLVVHPDTAKQRLGQSLDRMESRGTDYFKKLYDGFVSEAKRWPRGVELIDGELSVGEIQERLRKLCVAHFAGQPSRRLIDSRSVNSIATSMYPGNELTGFACYSGCCWQNGDPTGYQKKDW